MGCKTLFMGFITSSYLLKTQNDFIVEGFIASITGRCGNFRISLACKTLKDSSTLKLQRTFSTVNIKQSRLFKTFLVPPTSTTFLPRRIDASPERRKQFPTNHLCSLQIRISRRSHLISPRSLLVCVCPREEVFESSLCVFVQ
ncbi:hypothetical protein CEXT_500861 [Caerostris extrusa]|uniref:Uncharacterized protein n=1 Tax=Caerostris extrusa TaxID=172846 RepID=A0AAV4RXB4_CAEEX|nr:hypothetical protein CEXT_500861 [Caerostris extrusa]